MPIKRIMSRSRGDDDRVSAYVIEQEEEEVDDKIRYCESCKDNGYIVRLKKRLYFKIDKTGKHVLTEPDSDAELWRQCWRCGDIVKVSETKIEGSLSDVIEIDEPNSKEPSVQVLFPRKGRKGRLANLREGRNIITDPEAFQAIRHGQRVINYEEWQLEL